MMMTNNRNQSVFSSVNHVDDAQNVEYAQRGGGRPSSPSDEAQGCDRGIQKIDDAMTMLTMTTGSGGSGGVPTELRIPSSSTAKENVRPNSSGKKKHWRKKANHDHQRREADGDDVGPTTTTTRMTADGGGVRNTAVDKATTTKTVKALQPKIKMPVVVEISSSHQPEKKTPAARRILPSMDFQAAAAPASIDEGDGGEQEKKSLKKIKRKQWRKKLHAARRGDASGGGMDFSTNAGGASVLALLGQYPYVMPSVFDVYDGCTPNSCNQMTMVGGGEGYQHDHYDLSNVSSGGLPPMPYTGHHAYDEHYSYAATVAHVIHPGAAIMMPGGYYVPAMMNDQTVYYNQPNAATNAATNENAQYYHHPCYSPYACEAADPSSSTRRREGDDGRGKSPLNINAHEFMPLPAFDPTKETNSEA